MVSTALTGPERWRVESTVAALREAYVDGRSTLTVDEPAEWQARLAQADTGGWFFYSRATFVMVTEKSLR